MRVLAEYRYGARETVLYWKFSDIKQWCDLKSKTTMSHGCISFGDINIKCLKVIAWWLTDLILWGKFMELNDFSGDIMSDVIEKS